MSSTCAGPAAAPSPRGGRGRRRHALAVATVVVLALAGCTSSDPGPPAEGADGDGAGAVDQAEEPVAGPAGRLQLTGFRQDHPVGASVQLRAVEVDAAGHVLLDIEAVSTRSNVQIGRYSNLLEDDLGNRYQLVRVADNPELRLGESERMTGTLAFEGPVDPDATRFTFAMNQVSDDDRVSATDDSVSQFPAFLFTDVPFPGVGLEAEAVDSDAQSLLDAATVEVDQRLTSDDNPDVEVTVISVANDGRTVFIELEAVNRSDTSVAIINDQPRMTDDRGQRFNYLRDESGEDGARKLELEPGQEASATLAFLGTAHPEATELQLVLNALGIDRGQLGRPGFRATLPLPGASDQEEAP